MMILHTYGSIPVTDYIIQILNSQHGWIFIMVINNQYYDWGFQSRFSAMAIVSLSMDMNNSTMEGIVLSCCKHAPWHLGANAQSFFTRLIEDPTHLIVMSRPLRTTNCSCQKFNSIWSYLQSPCSLLHNDPALGGYTGWSFYEHKAISSPRLLQAWQPDTWGLHMWNTQFWLVIEMNKLDFFKLVTVVFEARLKLLLCYLLKTWGLQVMGI